jgi:hypothetical protein
VVVSGERVERQDETLALMRERLAGSPMVVYSSSIPRERRRGGSAGAHPRSAQCCDGDRAGHGAEEASGFLLVVAKGLEQRLHLSGRRFETGELDRRLVGLGRSLVAVSLVIGERSLERPAS